MFTISNIYGHGFDGSQFSRLEALGFRRRSQVSRYMGSQLCYFIDFKEAPSLELIEVEEDKEYLNFIPPGMIPYCPGISLTLTSGSKLSLNDFEREFQQLRPYALHVNYDGSLAPRGPGWNYLNFGGPVVMNTFIWLTEFDEPRPVRRYEMDHPNTVIGVEGLVFDLEIENLKGFSQLIGKNIEGERLKIDRLQAWSKHALNNLPHLHDKVFPLVMVILKAQQLDYFAALPDGAKEVSFMSRPAIHIETNKLSWDLLITT